MHAWDSLDDETRDALRAELPHGDDPERRRAALTELFARTPQHFGAPLDQFWRMIQARAFRRTQSPAAEARMPRPAQGGDLSEEAVAERRAAKSTHVQQIRDHHNALVHRLHYLKRVWMAPQARPRAFPCHASPGRLTPFPPHRSQRCHRRARRAAPARYARPTRSCTQRRARAPRSPARRGARAPSSFH